MKISLSENIQMFRKERGMTQEHLATAVGVTVGAVSKWETGNSNPDIELIPEIANLFEVSVDVLLGYKWEKHNLGNIIKQLQMLRKEREFDKGLELAKGSITKFPNQFELLYETAELWYGKAVTTSDQEAFTEAIKIYTKALDFVEHSLDKQITVNTLKENIANAYSFLSEFDKAIEILEKINENGVYDILIGHYLERSGKYSEAKKKLQTYICNYQIEKLISCLDSLANCYEQEGNIKESIAVYEYLLYCLDGLVTGDSGCYLRKIITLFTMKLASKYYMIGDINHTFESIKKAIEYAKQFDQNPEYNVSSIRFCEKVDKVGIDNIGSAVELIKMLLAAEFNEFDKVKELMKMI